MEKKIIYVQSIWGVLFWQIYTFYILLKMEMKKNYYEKAAHRFRSNRQRYNTNTI